MKNCAAERTGRSHLTQVPTYTIMSLDHPFAVACEVNKAIQLADKCRFIMGDDKGNAILEKLPGVKSDILVDGKRVYELAHVGPQQLIHIDGERYVLIPPFGKFLHPNSSAVKKELLVQKVARFLPVLETNPDTNTTETTLTPVAATEVRPPIKNRLAMRLPRWKFSSAGKSRRLLIAICSLFALIGVLSHFLPTAKESSPPETAAEVAAPKPQVPEVTQEKAVQPTPPPAAAAAPATKAEVKKPAKPVKSLPKDTAKHAVTGAVKEQIDSYVIEAQFDPEKARYHLKEMLKSHKGNPVVAQEIKNALARIRE